MVRIRKDGKIWGQNNSYKKEEYKEKMRNKLSGSNNGRWKGGISRNFKQYSMISKKIEQRCVYCDTTERLVCHHIDSNFRNNNLSNLMILCKTCHIILHNKLRKNTKHKNIDEDDEDELT